MDPELALQAAHGNVHVRLAHSLQHSLVRGDDRLEAERGVFFHSDVSDVPHLGAVGLRDRQDRHRVERDRDSRAAAMVTDFSAPVKGVAGLQLFELGDDADVAGDQCIGRHQFLAAHVKEIGDAAGFAGACRGQLRVLVDCAREDADVVHAAHVAVDDRLEDDCGDRTIRVGGQLDVLRRLQRVHRCARLGAGT